RTAIITAGLLSALPGLSKAQDIQVLGPSTLNFTATQGGAPPPAQTLTAGTLGAPVPYPLTNSPLPGTFNTAWVSVNDPSNRVLNRLGPRFLISVNPAGLAVGRQRASLEIKTPNASSLPVRNLKVL